MGLPLPPEDQDDFEDFEDFDGGDGDGEDHDEEEDDDDDDDSQSILRLAIVYGTHNLTEIFYRAVYFLKPIPIEIYNKSHITGMCTLMVNFYSSLNNIFLLNIDY